MNKKTIVIFIVIAIIVIAAYYFLKPGNKTEEETTTSNQGTGTTGSESSGTSNTNTQTSSCTNPGTFKEQNFPMKLGVQSNYVKIVQAKLNEKHSAGLSEDGKFGCDTKKALKQYTGKTEINSAIELYNTFLLA